MKISIGSFSGLEMAYHLLKEYDGIFSGLSWLKVCLQMARIGNVRRVKSRSQTYNSGPYQLSSRSHKMLKEGNMNHLKASERKDWEDATCSVCMESPHNAVLLLCASYNKGCRPYMCATGCRFSNCLDQYKKAYTKVAPDQVAPTQDLGDTSGFGLGLSEGKVEVSKLLCPLCRGLVKGWTVVEPARKYLNKKKRTCMHENCSFVGKYKQLKKHVKVEHPLAKPRKVDPALEEKWRRLERERERSDVISTIQSSMPGSVVVGDYVIENRLSSEDVFLDDEPLGDAFFHFAHALSSLGFDSYEDGAMFPVSRARRRPLFGRADWRRRIREFSRRRM